MPSPDRLLALSIVQFVSERNRASLRCQVRDIAENVKVPSMYFSPSQKTRASVTLRMLKAKGMIVNRNKGVGFRLLRPVEECEAELSKWIQGEREQEGFVKVVPPSGKFHPPVGLTDVKAKSIRLNLGGIAVTIELITE